MTTKCNINRGQFATQAKPVMATVAGQAVAVMVKEYSTWSLGWYAAGKVVVDMGGVPVTCQMAVQLTVIGSKELPK